MAHKLTEDQLARFREAFANWEIDGEGTIRARDVCTVMELVGETPSRQLRLLSDRPDAEDERFTFDEFLIVAVGPPWETLRPDPEGDMNKAIAAFDDGSGYAPLRDVMRIVHKYMKRGGNHTDGDIVEIYRQALDGSLFATVAGGLAPESVWKLLEEEFADLPKGHRRENAGSVTSHRNCCVMFPRLRFARIGPVRCLRQVWSQLDRQHVASAAVRDRAGDGGEPAGEAAHIIRLTVVDLGGNQLLTDAFASAWSVQALQQHIETVAGVPAHRQFLFVAGADGFRHELGLGSACLSRAGFVDGCTLVLSVKNEVKLDYKRFVSRLMDAEFEHSIAREQNHGRRA